LAGRALAEIIETEMAAAVDRHLEGGATQRGLGGQAAKLSQVAKWRVKSAHPTTLRIVSAATQVPTCSASRRT
jgi:hypothetical protein